MIASIVKSESRGMQRAIRKTNLAPIAALALAVASLTGCVSFGGDAPSDLIALTPEVRAPAGEIGSGMIGDAIVVLDPDADRRIDVVRVPVLVNDSTVAYLKDAVWVEKPARQFRRLLAETVRARSKRVVVEGSDYEVSGKTTLSGRLAEMGYDARLQAVVVSFDAVVEDEDGSVRSRRFVAEIPGVKAKVRPVAAALNEAANQVAGEVADWLGS